MLEVDFGYCEFETWAVFLDDTNLCKYGIIQLVKKLVVILSRYMVFVQMFKLECQKQLICIMRQH